MIAAVFKPSRVLEIGCSTGIIVKHLNDIGVEAHGIDVSEWAVENREHPNVVCAAAERLPYPDHHFDFVFSVHALEHIPVEHKVAAFAELGRVSGGGVHFHMLPMVGLGPYRGDPAEVIAALKKDPTHNLLEKQAWWIEQFAHIGLDDVHVPIFFANETGQVDLSVSQLLLSSRTVKAKLLQRIKDWNTNVFANKVRLLLEKENGIHIPAEFGMLKSMDLQGDWGDISFECDPFAFSDDVICSMLVVIDGKKPVDLRLCLLSAERDGEGDFQRTYEPGTTVMQFRAPQAHLNRGELRGKVIDLMLFGGRGEAAVSVALIVHAGTRTLFASSTSVPCGGLASDQEAREAGEKIA